MDRKKFAAEAIALIVIAVLCATLANAVAARNRKVAWSAEYPNALVVPAAPEPPPIVVRPAASLENAQILLPVPADPLPSTTIQQTPAETKLPLEAAPAVALSTPVPAPAVASSTPPPAPAPAREFPPHPEKPWVEISGEDVADLYGRKMLFIDARRTDVYNEGHIAGARSMPVWEADVDARVAALYEEGRDQTAPVVVYCSGGNCEDSHMLAQKLWGIGFDNVLVYKDGFPDWQKRGGAIARGPAQ